MRFAAPSAHTIGNHGSPTTDRATDHQTRVHHRPLLRPAHDGNADTQPPAKTIPTTPRSTINSCPHSDPGLRNQPIAKPKAAITRPVTTCQCRIRSCSQLLAMPPGSVRLSSSAGLFPRSVRPPLGDSNDTADLIIEPCHVSVGVVAHQFRHVHVLHLVRSPLTSGHRLSDCKYRCADH
jgi:hypothetical protein